MLISTSDANQFHRLYPLLLKYTASKIKDVKKRNELVHGLDVEMSVDAAAETRKLLFADPSLIQKYVTENPDKLDDKDLQAVAQWRNFRFGKFIIERNLKHHTIFLSMSSEAETFAVLGLTTEIDEMLGYQLLPIMVSTVLLQWKDRIVHDGFLAAYPISFGPGARRMFKKTYSDSKSKGIVTTFLQDQISSKSTGIKAQSDNVLPFKNNKNTSLKELIELKIVLNDVRPLVWRKVVLDPKISLYNLHFVIQKAMGWQNSHLHDFTVDDGTRRFGTSDSVHNGFEDEDEIEEADSQFVTLLEIFQEGYKKIIYNYDFGDSWEHTLTCVGKVERIKGARYPQCVDGSGACPPEDCGGSHGYTELCKVLSNPKDIEYRQMKKWVGRGFNPTKFSIDEVNKRLRSKTMESGA